MFKVKNRLLQYRDELINKKVNGLKNTTVQQWTVLACDDGELSDDLRETFRGLLFNIKKLNAKFPELTSIAIHEVDNYYIKVFRKILDEENLAGKTKNKYLKALEKLADYTSDKNVEAKISTKKSRAKQPKNETEQYPPLTHQEKLLAFNFYRDRKPEYYLFLLFIYYSCIRPGELHRVQVGDINLKAKTIHVPWMNAKNGNSNYVQILEPLFTALNVYNIKSMDAKQYLFGARCLPSAEQYEGHYTTDLWGRDRKSMGMPLDKQQYGLKHTFNIDYVEQNKNNPSFDWEWLRRHNRHATIQQTQKYISTLTAYFADETKVKFLNYHAH